ncbi:DNA polymerase III subunit delta [Betaproteobacteria bacterium PRO4]|nr:DNA polymerase III subunit delta [Betaproteobacteria bacterium PRO4]
MRPNPQHTDTGMAPLHVVFGGELLLVTETVDAIRVRARSQGYTERTVFTVDTRFDWGNLSQWGCQSSLFGERRVLELRIPTGKPGKEGGAAIEALCRNLPRDAIIIVTLPEMDKQGRASKWFKALENTARMTEIKPVGRDRLAHWVKQRLEQQRQTVDRDTLQFFSDKVEGNLLAAYQEIKKLELLYSPGPLSFEQIKDALLDVTRFDVFQLPEALLSADMVRYGRILKGLEGEGMAPPLILAVLSEQIRLLLKVYLLMDANKGMPIEQAMTALRIWPARQKLMLNVIQRVRYPQLVQALRQAALIDRVIKGVEQGDIWEEFLNLGACFAADANFRMARRNDFLSTINSSQN